jgi:HEAT repeat protein
MLYGSGITINYLRHGRNEFPLPPADSTRVAPNQPIANPQTTGSAHNKASFVELAALALTEGVRLEDNSSSISPAAEAAAGANTSEERRALFALLRTGREADALQAISEFSRLGGPSNCIQLAAIMRDGGWSDAVRTEAALGLLKAGTPAEARSSIKTLGVIGGEANTANLTTILNDATLPQELRVEAALSLGNIRSPESADALIAAFELFPDPEIHEQLLDTLGHFPFPQIESTWKEFLADPNTPDDLRAAAAEALASSTPESVEFLKSLAGSDRDPKVREEAAWALSIQGKGGNLGNELLQMALKEEEPDVRRRLYEALLGQTANPAEALLPTIKEESDVAARVAGFNAVADAVKREKSTALAAEFNGAIVKELREIALSSETLNVRMRAVFALRRAGTGAADVALRTISETQNPKIAQAAMNGLRASPN